MIVVKMLLHNKYKYIEPVVEQLFFKKKYETAQAQKLLSIHSISSSFVEHLLYAGAVLGLG